MLLNNCFESACKDKTFSAENKVKQSFFFFLQHKKCCMRYILLLALFFSSVSSAVSFFRGVSFLSLWFCLQALSVGRRFHHHQDVVVGYVGRTEFFDGSHAAVSPHSLYDSFDEIDFGTAHYLFYPYVPFLDVRDEVSLNRSGG